MIKTGTPKENSQNRLSLIQRLRMPLPELQEYYREKRKADYEDNQPMYKQIRFRKRTRPLILLLLHVYRFILGNRLVCMGEPPVVDDYPRIYACTHNFRFDFEMCFETIKKSCWLFMGDPNETYKNMDGFLLWLNGVILMDTDHRDDCQVGKETAIRLIEQGGSLLIYPEGAWNLSENLPVQHLYSGTAEIALRTGAKIIPIALEQYGKQYVINTGKPIDPAIYIYVLEKDNNPSSTIDTPDNKRNVLPYGLEEKKNRITEDLRDVLASLRWEIWERQGIQKRSSFAPDESIRFRKMIMDQSENGYTESEIERTRFHTEEEIEQNEIAKSLEQIIPSHANAFLFGKYN